MSRIPPVPIGAPETAALEGIPAAAAGSAGAVAGASPAAGSTPTDAVRRIAQELAEGRITRGEAIERIIDEALGADVVRAAPEQLRAEVAAALGSLVETDPYLQSLVRGLGPPPSSESR